MLAERRRIALVGVPVDGGAGQAGASLGPASLRIAGLLPTLRELGHQVDDLGDLAPESCIEIGEAPLPGRVRNLAEIAAWSRPLSRCTHALMREGACPVVLGGDHSLSMGSVNGVARYAREAGRALFVLWLDAHADFNTPATTPSGNLHGMSAAWLAGEAGLEAVFGPETRVAFDPACLTLFGVRSVDREERGLLRRRGITVVDMRQIDEFGVGLLVREVLERVAAADGLLHVSLDTDFLDPTLAPGVGTTVPGGATFREAHLIMELLHDSGRVASLDVVELNPFLDVRGQSSRLLVDLIGSLFGRRIIEHATAPGRAGSAG